MAFCTLCSPFLATAIVLSLVQQGMPCKNNTVCFEELKNDEKVYPPKSPSPHYLKCKRKELDRTMTVLIRGRIVDCGAYVNWEDVSPKPTIQLPPHTLDIWKKYNFFPLHTVLLWNAGSKELFNTSVLWMVRNVHRDLFKDGFNGTGGDEIIKYQPPPPLPACRFVIQIHRQLGRIEGSETCAKKVPFDEKEFEKENHMYSPISVLFYRVFITGSDKLVKDIESLVTKLKEALKMNEELKNIIETQKIGLKPEITKLTDSVPKLLK